MLQCYFMYFKHVLPTTQVHIAMSSNTVIFCKISICVFLCQILSRHAIGSKGLHGCTFINLIVTVKRYTHITPAIFEPSSLILFKFVRYGDLTSSFEKDVKTFVFSLRTKIRENSSCCQTKASEGSKTSPFTNVCLTHV